MRAARFFGFFVALAMLLFAAASHAAWAPPKLNGHVVDSAGVLSPAQAQRLNAKLDRARRETGFAVIVYLLPSLPDGMPIEDVGYAAGNAWGAGSKEGDDGVILIGTVTDRHLRIETGKGVGGALTDIQSSQINREVVGPLMKQGLYYEAMNRGTDAILKELVSGTEGGVSTPGRTTPPQEADPVRTIIGGIVLLLVIILAIVSPTFRHILFFMLLFGRGGGGRGGGGGGGGYGGGGGSFGGGGSSDNY
jgi:uncharacterized protein